MQNQIGVFKISFKYKGLSKFYEVIAGLLMRVSDKF